MEGAKRAYAADGVAPPPMHSIVPPPAPPSTAGNWGAQGEDRRSRPSIAPMPRCTIATNVASGAEAGAGAGSVPPAAAHTFVDTTNTFLVVAKHSGPAPCGALPPCVVPGSGAAAASGAEAVAASVDLSARCCSFCTAGRAGRLLDEDGQHICAPCADLLKTKGFDALLSQRAPGAASGSASVSGSAAASAATSSARASMPGMAPPRSVPPRMPPPGMPPSGMPPPRMPPPRMPPFAPAHRWRCLASKDAAEAAPTPPALAQAPPSDAYRRSREGVDTSQVFDRRVASCVSRPTTA